MLDNTSSIIEEGKNYIDRTIKAAKEGSPLPPMDNKVSRFFAKSEKKDLTIAQIVFLTYGT